jgi:hypothetical protein
MTTKCFQYYFLVVLIVNSNYAAAALDATSIKWDKSLHIFHENSHKIADLNLKCDFFATNSTDNIVEWRKHNSTRVADNGRVIDNQLVLTDSGNTSLISGAYTCELKSPKINKNHTLFNTKYTQLVNIHGN